MTHGLPAFRIRVNVSALQVHRGGLLQTVTQALNDNGLSPKQLEIESTLQHEENCVRAPNSMRALGITIAIDDFGTGYSCLNSLKNLPFQRLKVDRGFLSGIPRYQNNVAITKAITAMAHGLKMAVVAEGVETKAQETFLHSLGCDEAQGYLYAKPPAPEFIPAFVQNFAVPSCELSQ